MLKYALDQGGVSEVSRFLETLKEELSAGSGECAVMTISEQLIQQGKVALVKRLQTVNTIFVAQTLDEVFLD